MRFPEPLSTFVAIIILVLAILYFSSKDPSPNVGLLRVLLIRSRTCVSDSMKTSRFSNNYKYEYINDSTYVITSSVFIPKILAFDKQVEYSVEVSFSKSNNKYNCNNLKL